MSLSTIKKCSLPVCMQVSELAGVKLDRDINVVAFNDGRQVPLPPGTGYVDENGKVCDGWPSNLSRVVHMNC